MVSPSQPIKFNADCNKLKDTELVVELFVIENVKTARGKDDTFVEVGTNGDMASIWIVRSGNMGLVLVVAFDDDDDDDNEDAGDSFGILYVIVAIGYFASICMLGISGGICAAAAAVLLLSLLCSSLK